jgi:ABC-type multidrug transport system fused ATPase/permease subunit
MDNRSILETIGDSFKDLLESAVEWTPRILAAILLLIVGFIVARIVSKLVGRLINALEENKTVKNVAKKLDITVINISDLVALLTKWAVLLIFLIAAVDALGIAVLTDTFNEILSVSTKYICCSINTCCEHTYGQCCI